MYCQNCNKKSITNDNYCDRHKYYSKDNSIITCHIRNYIEKIEDAPYEINKVVIVNNLFRYFNNNINYILVNPHFKLVVFKKCKYLYQSIIQMKNEYQTFNNIEFNHFLDLTLNEIKLVQNKLKD